MVQLVYSPAWFFGKDIVIDAVSAVVLLLIGYFALQYYRLDKKNRNHLYLAISFFVLSVSFLFKILTNFTAYYWEKETAQIFLTTVTFQTLRVSNAPFVIGYLLNRILMIVGLYALWSIYQKGQTKTNFLFVMYLLIIATYLCGSAYYMFHITSLIILSLITAHFWRNYRKNKQETSKLVTYSFGAIALSQVFFIFVSLNPVTYVVAELIQLTGYLLLLITFMMVLSHAKKAK